MDQIQINSIVDINTNILNPKRGNTQAELKQGAAYNKKKNVRRTCLFMEYISYYQK